MSSEGAVTTEASRPAAGGRLVERRGFSRQPGTRLADGAWAVAVVIAAAGVILTVMSWGDWKGDDAVTSVGASVSGLFYATLGALIVRRTRNAVGWMLLGTGITTGLLTLLSSYAVIGILTHPGALPAAQQVGEAAEWVFFPDIALIVSAFLLFPTGLLPSRRWRPVAVANLAATGLLLLLLAVVPRPVELPSPGGVSLSYPNPFGMKALGSSFLTSLGHNLNALLLLSTLSLGAAAVSLVIRWRAGDGELRRQVNWVALTGAVFTLVQIVGFAGMTAAPVISSAALTASAFIGLFGFPAAITIAILKYRLYEIDVIINRAVVYGLVSAGLTAVYATIVLGIGALVGRHSGPVLTIAAAVAVALLFHPARERARRVANHLVYGQRATPYQVLSDFADSMTGQLGYDQSVDRMVTVLANATGASRAEAWVRVGDGLRPVAVWPDSSAPRVTLPLADGTQLPPFELASRAVAVRHGDELLGALTLLKPRNEPLTIAEDKLMQHLASQAGLVFRNGRLTAELQATIDELTASRRRLVTAQDTERRKIERNLHDGAQQQLVALSIQLGVLEQSAGDAGSVRELAPLLRDAARAALDDLRALARGIYPPLLADQGLVAALQAQARKATLPVTVLADGIGRYPQDTEATVYFCALEALQNIAKYAGASQAVVQLGCPEGTLEFTISDDGAGFDPASAKDGTGLQGMADRLAALGGTFGVRSRPGHGTTVTGQLPVPAR